MRFIYFVVLALFSVVDAEPLSEDLRVPAENDCKTIMDLFIVLDSSGSVGPTPFEQAKSALVDMVSRLDIGPKKVQVWVINYGSIVETPISYHNMTVTEFTKTNLIRKIKEIPYMNGVCTATGDALQEARRICNKRCRPFTDGVARVVIVFTDGDSNCGVPVGPESGSLHAVTSASVFAVGIGYDINNAELLSIATERRYVVHVSDYLQLTTAINNITVQTCGIPAFVVANVKVESDVDMNNFRYYQLDTTKLKQGRSSQEGFVEIIAHVTAGKVDVYTSTTDDNPGLNAGKRVVFRTRGAGQYYMEYINQDTERLYFSFHGLRDKNTYDFVVNWLDINGAVVG